ncbi:MAG TPA: TIGR01212 family radical SAM protein [Bacilli bacterium]|nr:TIGR01212 family radical SAM protein [Bacilli bacterium]
MKQFENSDSNKRYYTLDYYYRKKFNSKVSKISLNQNLTCPNIDGTKGTGGCIYCKHGGSEFGGDKEKSIKEQFDKIKEKLRKKWPNTKYIAYFQSNTNTYGDIKKLKKNFFEVLTYDDVVGINIATRCDAINDECLDLLDELNKKTYLTIELGLQTMHKKTSDMINRGHSLNEFEDMVKKLQAKDINIVVHIINGLPYETKDMMIETIKYLNNLKIDGIKIHMLHILKDTAIEKLYKKEHFHILTKEEYVDIAVSQLEYLDKNIIIHRITGDPDKNDLIEPTWLIKKFCVLNDIDKEQVKRDSWQGKKLQF